MESMINGEHSRMSAYYLFVQHWTKDNRYFGKSRKHNRYCEDKNEEKYSLITDDIIIFNESRKQIHTF